MKKKILIGLVSLVVILGLAFVYMNYRNRTLSPPGSASVESAGLKVDVTYSRPSVRGRLIFGTEEQKALQPYGKYWRLGANESTEISINKDITFNGTPLKAGKYRLYAIPGPSDFEIIVNTEVGKWGAFEPDHSKDLFTTKVPVHKNKAVEQYTITLQPDSNGVDMIFEWSDARFNIPLRLNP